MRLECNKITKLQALNFHVPKVSPIFDGAAGAMPAIVCQAFLTVRYVESRALKVL